MADNVVVSKEKLDSLADSINSKAGTSGNKNIDELKETVETMSIGAEFVGFKFSTKNLISSELKWGDGFIQSDGNIGVPSTSNIEKYIVVDVEPDTTYNFVWIIPRYKTGWVGFGLFNNDTFIKRLDYTDREFILTRADHNVLRMDIHTTPETNRLNVSFRTYGSGVGYLTKDVTLTEDNFVSAN